MESAQVSPSLAKFTRISFDAHAMNGVVLHAGEIPPREIHMGMNGVVVIGRTGTEVIEMYEKYIEAKQRQYSSYR